ncbi:hypothetical protein PFISCL1PPCAC_25421 [Pristionchus fissidentatus]|uniref:CTP synthase (glutamine hydrolyzing) n=1 Tax=Pristionchus fissidentatus TaxID=1538716 RepID=A0AAV5WTX6_9BILA|nr:hypothetical protein PFISCL1PPCAC_25421 [Pristionchus fissidentatus]
MKHWTSEIVRVDNVSEEVTIVLVEKYVRISDAYASINKALHHAAIHCNRKLVLKTLNSELLEEVKEGEEEQAAAAWDLLQSADGIIVPGGFDNRGVEGMINACKFVRENKIPFLGVCLGMQCASIEFARNVLGIEGANSTEMIKEGLTEQQQVVIDMPEHDSRAVGMGGTMRLGLRTTVFLTENCKLRALYGSDEVSERHRHRYEVNPSLVPELSRNGLHFVGMGEDEENSDRVNEKKRREENDLMEKIEKLCERGGDNAVRMEMVELDERDD